MGLSTPLLSSRLPHVGTFYPRALFGWITWIEINSPPPPTAYTGKRCYVPVVEDKNSNMKFLHLGEPCVCVCAFVSIFSVHKVVDSVWLVGGGVFVFKRR